MTFDPSAIPLLSMRGIRIYQEFNLVPELTAAENIFLGQEATRAGFVARGEERRRAAELFRRLGVAIDLDTPCSRLTTAQQQLVEIARALARDTRIIVMDEPTAALTAGEVSRLFEIIRDLKSRGIAVIYISHRLDEIFALADRVVVLRDGRNVGTRPLEGLSRTDLIKMMVGRELEAFGRHVDQLRIKVPHQEERVRNLSGGNQQKVVLAKWLERDCEVLFFDEPTRGIDVGARHEIYLLMNDLAARGKAIVMVSSELPEVLGLADRILVMHEGRITGEIASGPTVTQEEIMRLAMA